MAQKTEGSRRKKVTTRQQKDEDRRNEIAKLTEEIEGLRSRLEEVNEERGQLDLPQLENLTLHHAQYGDGTVIAQNRDVITVSYPSGERRQKLTFVIASGCVTLDDESIRAECQKILFLDREQEKLNREIRHRMSRISDLESEIARYQRE